MLSEMGSLSPTLHRERGGELFPAPTSRETGWMCTAFCIEYNSKYSRVPVGMGDGDRTDCVLIGPHICSMSDPRLPDCSVLTKAEKVTEREETALDRLHQSSRQARPTSMDRPPAAGRRRSGRAKVRAKVPFLPQTSRPPSSPANLQPPRALGRSSRPHLRTWQQVLATPAGS